MTNFIFKSSERTTDLQKINHSIEVVLHEQRRQRADLADILRLLQLEETDKGLQKQVDDYFGDKTVSETRD